MLASADADGIVKLWDVSTGTTLQTLKVHLCHVNAVAFSLDGKVLAPASSVETVKLWDASTGAVLQTLEAVAVFQYISFNEDGTFFVTDIKMLGDIFYPEQVTSFTRSICWKEVDNPRKGKSDLASQ